MRPKFSKAREDLIAELAEKFDKLLARQQSRLLKVIEDGFFDLLDTSGGNIEATLENQIRVGELDTLYAEFISTEGVQLMERFIRDAKALFNESAKYFREASDAPPDEFARILEEARRLIFGGLGYDVDTNTFITGGRLETIVADQTPINAIKLEVNAAIANNAPRVQALKNVEIVTIGDAKTTGSTVRHFNNSMPDPFYQFDRKTGQNVSKDLKLDYAIYQGGLIKTSRPFCVVRNNHVYTREEIEKFGTSSDQYGGYTNKAAGDFAGKKTPYDPFRDLGGYNCRHALDWISENLAFRLRPDLKPPPPQPSGL